jgi:hypothetical protein
LTPHPRPRLATPRDPLSPSPSPSPHPSTTPPGLERIPDPRPSPDTEPPPRTTAASWLKIPGSRSRTTNLVPAVPKRPKLLRTGGEATAPIRAPFPGTSNHLQPRRR